MSCGCRADFPMFEWDEEGQRLVAMHHPFTAPNPEDLQGGNGAGLRGARALAYDLVYNGVEVAGTCAVMCSETSSMVFFRVMPEKCVYPQSSKRGLLPLA